LNGTEEDLPDAQAAGFFYCRKTERQTMVRAGIFGSAFERMYRASHAFWGMAQRGGAS